MPNGDEAPGWDAIDGAMRQAHGPGEPRHWGSMTALPGGPGLSGISAYDAGDHWHFVTLGLTELWLKEGDDPEVSGLGYELTMRTPERDAEEPPAWTVRLLQRLADVALQGMTFAAG